MMTYHSKIEKIKEVALKEYHEELFRKEVELYKEKLKSEKWWHKIIPLVIVIKKREKL